MGLPSDTQKDSISFPVRSTLAMQHEDGGPWAHGTTGEANSSDHRGRSYIIRAMKMGRLITLSMRHIHSTPVTTKQYL